MGCTTSAWDELITLVSGLHSACSKDSIREEPPTACSEEKSTATRWPESINFAHAATSRRYSLCPRKDLVTTYYTDIHSMLSMKAMQLLSKLRLKHLCSWRWSVGVSVAPHTGYQGRPCGFVSWRVWSCRFGEGSLFQICGIKNTTWKCSLYTWTVLNLTHLKGLKVLRWHVNQSISEAFVLFPLIYAHLQWCRVETVPWINLKCEVTYCSLGQLLHQWWI